MYHKIGNVEKMVCIFQELGFNDEQILKLVSNKKKYINRLDNIKEAFEYYQTEMKKRNYTEEEIHALATTYPNAIFYRFYRGIMKKEYRVFIDQYRLSKDNSKDTNLNIQGITKVLKSIGISQNQLDHIYTFNCSVLWMNKSDLLDNIAYHRSCDISDEQLKVNVNNYPRNLELGEKELSSLLTYMEKFSLTKKDLGKLLTTCSKLKIKIDPERFIDNLKWAQEKGLDLEKLGKNILKSNLFVINKKETLEKDFLSILKLDLSENETKKIVSSAPSVLTMDKARMAYIMNLFILFGMSEEEMKRVITEYPAIFTVSIDNILKKLRVLRDYDLLWYIILKPKNLIQGAELIETRAEYLKTFYHYEKKEFARLVFLGKKDFKSKFDVSNNILKNKKILQKV